MSDEKNIENTTLDQIEHPKKKTTRPKIQISWDLIIALVLVIGTIATLVMWYLAVSKV